MQKVVFVNFWVLCGGLPTFWKVTLYGFCIAEAIPGPVLVKWKQQKVWARCLVTIHLASKCTFSSRFFVKNDDPHWQWEKKLTQEKAEKANQEARYLLPVETIALSYSPWACGVKMVKTGGCETRLSCVSWRLIDIKNKDAYHILRIEKACLGCAKRNGTLHYWFGHNFLSDNFWGVHTDKRQPSLPSWAFWVDMIANITPLIISTFLRVKSKTFWCATVKPSINPTRFIFTVFTSWYFVENPKNIFNLALQIWLPDHTIEQLNLWVHQQSVGKPFVFSTGPSNAQRLGGGGEM